VNYTPLNCTFEVPYHWKLVHATCSLLLLRITARTNLVAAMRVCS